MHIIIIIFTLNWESNSSPTVDGPGSFSLVSALLRISSISISYRAEEFQNHNLVYCHVGFFFESKEQCQVHEGILLNPAVCMLKCSRPVSWTPKLSWWLFHCCVNVCVCVMVSNLALYREAACRWVSMCVNKKIRKCNPWSEAKICFKMFHKNVCLFERYNS